MDDRGSGVHSEWWIPSEGDDQLGSHDSYTGHLYKKLNWVVF